MTELSLGMGEPPQALLLAIEQLISGERTIAEFRDELLNALYDRPASAPALAAMVDDYARRGLIPEQIQRLLRRDIDKVTSEEHPTTPTEFTYGPDDTAELGLHDTGGLEVEEEPDAGEASAVLRPLSVGDLLRDRFEIVGRASGGSMGVVYKAIDRRLAEAEGGHPFVAIKVLAEEYAQHPGAMRALQQEAAKGRYLNHPNIVRFLDLDRSGDRVFLVMEWLDGRALSEVLAERPGTGLPREEAFNIIERIGAALSHAHRMGVTHADVKPGNIMVLADGTTKLLDFGIARVRGGSGVGFDSSFLQAATPAYASPQVLAGGVARPVDDVFSLACVAYRLLSGYRVFRDSTALEAQERGESARSAGAIDRKVWRALEAALQLDAEQRTASIDQFLRTLGLGARERRLSWSVAGWIGASALLLGALGTAALYAPQWRRSETTPAPSGVTAAVPSRANEVTQSPPGIEFTVTRADVVAAPLPPANYEVTIDPGRPIEDPVPVAVFEDAGPERVRLRLAPGAEAVPLRVRQQPVPEAWRPLVADSVALSVPEGLADGLVADADIEIEYLPDTAVEPDALMLFDIVDSRSGVVLAQLEVTLRDDERQRLAAALPPDTVSFASSTMEVRESDGAFQLTAWRLNPRAGALSVPVEVQSISARRDEDYVLRDPLVLEFEAGQTIVTEVVPLVRDTVPEPTEVVRFRFRDEPFADGVQVSVTVRILDINERDE